MKRSEHRIIHLFGVGHNTPVFIDLVEACGHQVGGIYHYNETEVGKVCGNKMVTGTHEEFFRNQPQGKCCVLTMGDNQIRCALANRLRKAGGVLPTIIHPSAVVSCMATLEEGVVVHALGVIQAGAQIGRDSVISTQAAVIHSSRIGRGCYLAVQCCVGAYVNVADQVLVGMGASLVAGKVKTVGSKAVIGAGSVVLRDVASAETVYGNPARSDQRS